MKKGIIIGIIVILLVLAGIFFWVRSHPVGGVLDYEDLTLEQMYPKVADGSYKGFLTNESETLFYNSEENVWSCRNALRAVVIEYSYEGPSDPEIVGGWMTVYVISCSSEYYVWEFPGFPGDLYGPFEAPEF
ncbi:hypothetical protein CMI45_02025 [Candidatus Pacearchaeota archaeon]|nr:hypothetical protein [Candidatus Pacearchaeota archaeon]|tara:strand:- start:2968 stop:3363 length:396 start_codon:yes stop_codon:yes gene_type:complete